MDEFNRADYIALPQRLYKHPLSWWKGRRFTLISRVDTPNILFLPGHRVSVIGKYKGLEVAIDPCEKCGTMYRLKSVPLQHLGYYIDAGEPR